MAVRPFLQLSKMFLFNWLYIRGEKHRDETLFVKYSCSPIIII